MTKFIVNLDSPSSHLNKPKVTKNNFLKGVKYVPYEGTLVSFVDRAVEMAHGNTSHKIETESDWKVVEFLYKGFSILYPQDCQAFENYMHKVHLDSHDNRGISKGEHGAQLEHLLEIPEIFYKMIMVIFPEQKIQDKVFARKFMKRFKMVAGHV